MTSLDNLVRTPQRFGINSTALFHIEGGTYLVRALDGPVLLSSGTIPEIIHVTRGEVEADINGSTYVVPAGFSSYLSKENVYRLSPGSEVIRVNHPGKPEEKVYKPAGHTDSRRSIVDITSTVKHFRVADVEGLELGHHYHAGFDEVFHVTREGFVIHFEDPNTKECGFYRVEEGQQIKVPLGVAHLVIPDPGMEMINVCSRPFSRDDLNGYKVPLQTKDLTNYSSNPRVHQVQQ